MSALVSLGRVEEAITMLKSILQDDSPSRGALQTYNKDVINQVKEIVEKSGTAEIKVEFNRIEKYFRQQGQICEIVGSFIK